MARPVAHAPIPHSSVLMYIPCGLIYGTRIILGPRIVQRYAEE